MPPDIDLVYYPDSRPGIQRRRQGRGFSYIAPDGTTIDRGAERARLEAMAIPPAYDRVWMTPLPNGHLLATGFDARARKQYRYHPEWAQARAETKFSSLAEFGRLLPGLRRRVARDLEAEAGERDFALAAAVALIDRLAFRVGHPEYAAENGSYGASTLQRRHMRVTPQGIVLSFPAKGGRRVRQTVTDRRLARVLQKAHELPGAELLTWIDAQGAVHSIGSAALNDYLREAAGAAEVSAKTFRTWAGTLAAFQLARDGGPVTIRAMAEAAAARLHNTPAIARKSYIHPAVIGLAGSGPALPPRELPEPALPDPVRMPGLIAGEGHLLAFLEKG